MLPHWPAEVHYTGVGYGAYPFWKGNEGAKDHAPIEVWYSERLASEKFSHSACSLDLVGDPGATKGTKVPCVHLMVGTVHPRPHEAAPTLGEHRGHGGEGGARPAALLKVAQLRARVRCASRKDALLRRARLRCGRHENRQDECRGEDSGQGVLYFRPRRVT